MVANKKKTKRLVGKVSEPKKKVTPTLITDQDGQDIVLDAMSRYAEYAAEDRAIQRIEDGLKPVHRRILWAAHSETKARTRFEKSAAIVGDTLKAFHPHGDSSVYGAMVGMVNDRYPTLDGQGNWGNAAQDDPAAAYRYTESRLSAIARILAMDTPDIEVVPYAPNYTNKKREPVFLPMRLPLILLNGGTGIAVGINAGIPPHNVEEVIDAVITSVETGDTAEGAKKIKGPDYGTGIILSSKSDIKSLYKTGDGTIEYSCEYKIEAGEKKRGGGREQKLVITSIAPEFSIKRFMEECGKLQDNKSILYARDESSNKNGVRIVVGFDNPSAIQKFVIPKLRKKINYKFNVLVSAKKKLSEQNIDELNEDTEGEKRVKIKQLLPLPEILREWISARKKVIHATLRKELKGLRVDLEKEQGKRLAREQIDKLLAIVKSGEEMVPALVKKLGMTQLQAETVAAMRVDTLQKSSQEKIAARISELKSSIKRVKEDLKDIPGVLVRQVREIEDWFKKNAPETMKRGTKLSAASGGDSLDNFKSDLKWTLWEEGKAEKNDTPPLSVLKNGVKKPRGLVPYRDTLTVLYSDNTAVQVNAGSYQPSQYFKQGKVVGIVGDEGVDTIAVADADGKVLLIDYAQKVHADEFFETIKSEHEAQHAVGLNLEKDRLVLRLENGSLVVREPGGKTSRRNSRPRAVGRSRKPLVGFWRLPPGHVLASLRGGVVELPEAAGEEPTTVVKLSRAKVRTLVVLNKNGDNLIIYNGTGGSGKGKDKREIVGYKKALAEMKEGNVSFAFPLPSSDNSGGEQKKGKKKGKKSGKR